VAEQNAVVATNAEAYYRSMFERDTHSGTATWPRRSSDCWSTT
jgi:hypothetical protein